LIWALLVVQELRELFQSVTTKGSRWSYFKDNWNYVEWLGYILLSILVALRITIFSYAITFQQGRSVDNIRVDEWSYLTYLQYHQANVYALACLVFWFKTLKFLRIFSELGVLLKVIRNMFNDILIWGVLFVMLTIGFSLAFYVSLGNVTWSYRNWGAAILTLIRVIFSDLTWSEIEITRRYFAYAFFFVYLFACAVVLLNLLIAMLSQTYEVIYEKAKQQSGLEFANILFGYVDVDTYHVENAMPFCFRSGDEYNKPKLTALGRWFKITDGHGKLDSAVSPEKQPSNLHENVQEMSESAHMLTPLCGRIACDCWKHDGVDMTKELNFPNQ